MARYVNQGLEKPARLSVISMKGWQRGMTWADTGLPWVSPSPNLRSPDAALAYPGVALLEATNISEGRGTASPFLTFGAPWLRSLDLEVSAPGFKFDPVLFTPSSSPAAPNPKYLDQKCHGLSVRVTDPSSAQPYRLGVEVLAALSGRDGFEWKQDGTALTRLLGSPRLVEDLLRGKTVERIIKRDRADHEKWRRIRASALLY